MYSLDVNFLSDREERVEVEGARRTRQVSASPRPLYIGAIVGALLPGLVGGLWFFLQTQRSALQAELDDLNAELVNVQAALAEVSTIQQQVQQISTENQALATVFDQIQPWSALLEDFRDNTPEGIQISSIVQTQPPPVAVAPVEAPAADPNDPNAVAAAPPPPPEQPPAKLTFEGYAGSFDDVNDFVLLLQQSPFLSGETVRLNTANLAANPTQVVFPDGQEARVSVELPDVVTYSIEAELTDRPASELLQNMRNAFAVGLPARIDTLRDLGVIVP
jgi:type IV pilus assembly protein PilN